MISLGKNISEPKQEQQKKTLWGKTSASRKKNSKKISLDKNISEPKEEQQNALIGEKHQRA
jgi:hypothetical protein